MKKVSIFLLLIITIGIIATGCGKTTNSSNTNKKEESSKEQQEVKKQESKLKMGIYYDKTADYYAEQSIVVPEEYWLMMEYHGINGPVRMEFSSDGTVLSTIGYCDGVGQITYKYQTYFDKNIEYVKLYDEDNSREAIFQVIDSNNLKDVTENFVDDAAKRIIFFGCQDKTDFIYLED